MQSTPLLISSLLKYGTTVHADQEVVTWTGEGARRMSYGELGKECARFAHAMRGLGIDGDQRIATFMWNNAEHMAAYLAIPSMGAVMHALNIRLAPEQIIFTANHGGSEVVIVDNTLAAPFAKVLAYLPKIREVVVNGPIPDETREALLAPEHVQNVHDWTELLSGQPDSFDWPTDLDENSASSLCYTSGTTGNPKGVAYSHRSNYLHSIVVPLTVGLRPGDRSLVVVPLFHANAWGFPYLAMSAGVSMMMPDRYLQGPPLAKFIESEGITNGAGVPTVWGELLRALDEGDYDTSKCSRLIVGGAACPPQLMHDFSDRHDIQLIQGWGMTETSPVGALAIPSTQVEVGSETYWKNREAQGRILCGVDMRLAAADGTFAPWDGESQGEVELRGPWITARYMLNGTESEAERDDMLSKFDGEWLRTGDVGTISEDGFLVLTDRAKDVIKSGGEWISSVALENAIMAHPEVVEASVVGVPDQKWGERPLATVVLAEGSALDAEALRTYLVETGTARWQVPERWAFIDEVPKTSVGKYDKRALRQRHAEGELDVKHVG